MKRTLLYFFATLYPFWAFAQKGYTYQDSVCLNLVQHWGGHPLSDLGLGKNGLIHNTRVVTPFCPEVSNILTCTSDSVFNYDLTTSLSSPIDVRIGEVDYWGDNSVKVITSNWDSIFLNDGTGWYYSGHRYGSSDFIFIGAGKKYAYASNGVSLSRYDGSGPPIPIYSGYIGCLADLIVDRDEHVWLLTGQTWPYIAEMRIVDSSGLLKCILPFEEPLYAINGYGMTVIGGQAYIGFGSSNPAYPNSLVPLIVTDGMVKLGPPVPFPHSTLDLGTCNKNLLPPRCAISHAGEVEGDSLTIWPNPVSDRLLIQNYGATGLPHVQVYDAYARCMVNTFASEIACSHWAPGVYWIRIETGGRTTVKMVIK